MIGPLFPTQKMMSKNGLEPGTSKSCPTFGACCPSVVVILVKMLCFFNGLEPGTLKSYLTFYACCPSVVDVINVAQVWAGFPNWLGSQKTQAIYGTECIWEWSEGGVFFKPIAICIFLCLCRFLGVNFVLSKQNLWKLTIQCSGWTQSAQNDTLERLFPSPSLSLKWYTH